MDSQNATRIGDRLFVGGATRERSSKFFDPPCHVRTQLVDVRERMLAGIPAQYFVEKKLSKPGIGLGFFDPAAFAEVLGHAEHHGHDQERQTSSRCDGWKLTY